MPNDRRFSERTLLSAVDLYRALPSAWFEKVLIDLSMSLYVPEDLSVYEKANKLARFAQENPNHLTPLGSSLWDEIVEQAVLVHTHVWQQRYSSDDMRIDMANLLDYSDATVAFRHALKQDGFEITGGKLRRILPPEADLPQTSDELHDLLDELDMSTLKCHLDQAIEAHTRGEWASANGQLRNVLQELFDEIARRKYPACAGNKTGKDSRNLLAKNEPPSFRPFFQEELHEWNSKGQNFVGGIFKLLNTEGPHPGLSNEADCTFRLHLVLVVAHYFARRAKSYLAEKGSTPL